MNLGGSYPFEIPEEPQRGLPQRQFAFAQCPHCKTPQASQILNEELRAINLTCSNCKKGFCSYCNKKRHIFGQCSEAEQYRMSAPQRRR